MGHRAGSSCHPATKAILGQIAVTAATRKLQSTNGYSYVILRIAKRREQRRNWASLNGSESGGGHFPR